MNEILFVGASVHSAKVLEGLLCTNLPWSSRIASVVTKPPRRRSRSAPLTNNPVQEIAEAYKLPHVYDLDRDKLSNYKLAFVVAWGSLIKNAELSSLLFLNAHYSDLPKYRGAAPVERAILNGEKQTAISIMRIIEELDAGPIYLKKYLEISDNYYLSEIYQKLNHMAVEAFCEVLQTFFDENLNPVKEPVAQFGAASYAKKLEPSELELRAEYDVIKNYNISRLERSYFWFGKIRVKVLEAKPVTRLADNPQMENLAVIDGNLYFVCKGGMLKLISVLPENKKKMSGSDFVRGYLRVD